MLNQYERSAVAESNEGIGVLAADNAAEQQNSFSAEMSTAQMLYSVVAHNVANPDKRIALSPEQGKEIMKDFVDFVAGSNEPPTTEDGRIRTFNEMDDNELLKCLFDYLGSAIANSSINGAIIETAQEMIAEQYMSEEELEDLPDPKTPRGRELRDKKLLDKMREAVEDMEKQLKENRDKWDKDTHDYGGEQLTGAEIMERIEWFSKKENQDKVRKELIKNGKSAKEADEILAKMKERDELMKHQRDGIPPLTAEEKARLNALNKDQQVIRGTKAQEEVFKAEKAQNATIQHEQENVISAVSERAELLRRQREVGQLSADEQTRLTALNKDSSVMAVQSFIKENAKVGAAPVADATPDQPYVLSSSTHKGADGYEIFSSAPHVKEAFVAASVETNQGEEPSIANKRGIDQANNNRPVITAAKVDATANAFM